MNNTTTQNAHPGYGTKPYRAYALSALLVIYIFEVVDRILLAILQEQVRVDLQLSDFQLGLLGGPAFVFLYVLSTVPIARIAERKNRITIVAAGAAVWSAATAVCGLAQNFAQLFIARMAVGIGEAACVPPSHSVLSDYFPSNKRASAMAIFGLAIPIGTVLAAFGGGWLAQNLNWRVAFLILGGLGVAAAIILKLTVKEPPRSGAKTEAPKFGEAIKLLASKHSYWHAILGGAILSIYGFSLTHFFVSYTIREYGLELSTASSAFGLLFGFAVGCGIFLGGFLCDRLLGRHPRIFAWLPAGGLVASIPLYLLAFSQSSYVIACVFFFFALLLHYMFHAPMFTVAQQVAEPRLRATASALMMLILTLIGYGLGPPLVGAIADHFNALKLDEVGLTLEACKAAIQPSGCAEVGGYGLKMGLRITLVSFVWAAVHFWFIGRTYAKDRFD